ncbi:DUF3822 family protein [Pseudozobellia thermophila]|uniref:DUF3822 domain-containing protein n=1 Tax=Pseudozobellia thermophila TaxID=192903 RepID=A0A1M6GRE3_9FLAO|nr:DUF3822 family protein [Pseudozobellia thermophila]SHJ12470.1 Protein of unknown function [Pseudozobellia thermophila]
MTKKAINNITDHSEDNFKKLSIQVGLNGLSFCAFDSESNSVLKSERLSFEKTLTPYEVLKHLKQLFQKNDLADERFAEVVVVHRNALFGLVPKSLFSTEELANYLKFNAKILANDHLAYDEFESHDIVNVYVPFVNINNYIYELFGEFTFKHNGTVMVESLLNGYTQAKQAVCFVYVQERQMDLTIIDQKKLLLFNSYLYNTKEDFLYYLLFALEQLKLDSETVPLKLFGAVDEGDEIYDICYRYIKNVSIFVPDFGPHAYYGSSRDAIDFTVINAL